MPYFRLAYQALRVNLSEEESMIKDDIVYPRICLLLRVFDKMALSKYLYSNANLHLHHKDNLKEWFDNEAMLYVPVVNQPDGVLPNKYRWLHRFQWYLDGFFEQDQKDPQQT